MDWFRFYSEVVRDPKVQKLSPIMFKHWINVLCLANDNEPRGRVPTRDDVAFHLRIAYKKADVMLGDLETCGLLDLDEEGYYWPHGWNARQYKSDNVTERVRKHRRNVSETPPETDTEQIQNRADTDDRAKPVHVDDPIDQIAADFAAFGMVTAGTPRAIEDAVEDYSLEWTRLAVRYAAGCGFDGQPPWSYVEMQLKRWKKQGHPDEVLVDAGKPMGRNAAPTQAPIDTLTAIYAAYPSMQRWTDVDGGTGDGGLATVDGDDDQARLEVRR